MAKDDYHVIIYQILSYLYVQLKSGKPVQSDSAASIAPWTGLVIH